MSPSVISEAFGPKMTMSTPVTAATSSNINDILKQAKQQATSSTQSSSDDIGIMKASGTGSAAENVAARSGATKIKTAADFISLADKPTRTF
jgi:hypothetical protein